MPIPVLERNEPVQTLHPLAVYHPDKAVVNLALQCEELRHRQLNEYVEQLKKITHERTDLQSLYPVLNRLSNGAEISSLTEVERRGVVELGLDLSKRPTKDQITDAKAALNNKISSLSSKETILIQTEIEPRLRTIHLMMESAFACLRYDLSSRIVEKTGRS